MGKSIRDQVIPVLVLLETTEGHLGAGDVLLGVLEVGELQNALASAGSSPSSWREEMRMSRVY